MSAHTSTHVYTRDKNTHTSENLSSRKASHLCNHFFKKNFKTLSATTTQDHGHLNRRFSGVVAFWYAMQFSDVGGHNYIGP